MLRIGEKNILRVSKQVDFGVYFHAGEQGEVLMPQRYVPAGLAVDDELEVFIYTDSEDRLLATTETPKVMVGQCAYLTVVAVNRVGAFLDWGLPKDLLVAFNQQAKPMQVGQAYVVYAYLDKHRQRVAASSKLSLFLAEEGRQFKPQQAVQLLVCAQTQLGYKAVVEGSHLGLIFNSEAPTALQIGTHLDGYIKAIRAQDGRIDLSLARQPQSRQQLHEQILAHLRAQQGVSQLTDTSSPQAIFAQFGVSKSSYKKALGALYKDQRIVLSKQCIKLRQR